MTSRYRRPCARCGHLLPEFSTAHRCKWCTRTVLLEDRERRAKQRKRTTDDRRATAVAKGPNATLADVGPIAAEQFMAAYPDDVARMRSRVANYRITLGQWVALVHRQGSRCAICKTEMPAPRLHIDHCHASGRVRGLLCMACNTGLGQLGIDGPEATERAASVIRYLTGEAKSSSPFADPRRDPHYVGT